MKYLGCAGLHTDMQRVGDAVVWFLVGLFFFFFFFVFGLCAWAALLNPKIDPIDQYCLPVTKQKQERSCAYAANKAISVIQWGLVPTYILLVISALPADHAESITTFRHMNHALFLAQERGVDSWG